MRLLSDFRVLYHMVLKPVRGLDHAARLESFYAGQAEAYDDFRRRLLPGRAELYRSIPMPEQAVWVDLGGGTASNLEFLGTKLAAAKKIYVVDLSASLLGIAEKRAREKGWTNVELAQADATTFRPAEGSADVVSFSYSLTMIPDWFAALENVRAILKPRGTLGVVDFFVARKYPEAGRQRHSWFTRYFWPVWFGTDNVFLSPDHVPYLHWRFQPTEYVEGRAKVPYMPLVRVPYYRFVGRRHDA